MYSHSLHGSEAMWKESGVYGDGSEENEATQYWYLEHILDLSSFTEDDLNYSTVLLAEHTNPGMSSVGNYGIAPL